jgi:hypothetical protein
MSLAIQACRDAGLPVVGPDDCTCRLRGQLVVLASPDELRIVWPYDQRCPIHGTQHQQPTTPEDELQMGTTLIPPFATGGSERNRALTALAEANRVRLRRASLMRWLHGQSSAHSHERAAELILEPDPALYSMPVLELHTRVRQVGSVQAERMLKCADIALTCTVGSLTSRQRRALAALLRLRADQLAHHTRSKTAP